MSKCFSILLFTGLLIWLNFYSGATTSTRASSARAMSASGKESEGEVDRVKDTEEEIVDSKVSHSLSVGITNENGGSIHLEQVSMV